MEEENSVYGLITKLCEKFSNDRCVVKKLRTTAYEILLKKRATSPVSRFKDIKGPNSFCNVLAWQYTLATQYGLEEHGRQIRECAEYVHENYGDAILDFLMCLRNVPNTTDEDMEFDLPESFRSLYKFPSLMVKSESETTIPRTIVEIDSRLDIWEVPLREKYNKRKNWEDFGHPEPDKEKPFLSELGDQSNLWVENLYSVYQTASYQQQNVMKVKFIPLADFIKDIKYLLVGLASNSFHYDEFGKFILLPNVTINGIPPATLKFFCHEFIFCGNCFKALNEMSSLNPATGEYKHKGYIFAELCQGIQRYLEFYRTAIMIRLPDIMGLQKLHTTTNHLRRHLTVVAAVCKVGPYAESETIPKGVLLLNYLYQTVLNLTDSKMLMVLYSLLFPCCQVYFNRFLQQWMLEGTINDPYNEFFIKPNVKFLSTRGRTYWTRSYTSRTDIVPDFLEDLRGAVLDCGKTMNLLRMCFQTSKLCLYLMGKKPPLISCCLTSEQLRVLEQNATTYYLEVLSECGPMLNIEQILKKDKELDPVFMNLIAKKKAATLQRLELERKKQLEEEKERKLDEMTALREQYDSALQLKQARVASEIENEIKLLQFNLSVENLRDKLIERESAVLIDYYNDLFAISEKRKKKIEKHIEALKNNQLEQVLHPLESNSSEESFYSIDEPVRQIESEEKFVDSESNPPPAVFISSQSLDIINANNTDETAEKPDAIKATIETFETARKIKEKVLAEEMGIIIQSHTQTKPIIKVSEKLGNLTEAQRNKLRVMGSEFGLDIAPANRIFMKRTTSQSEINRNVNMKSNECFYGNYQTKPVDNDNAVKRNAMNNSETMRKSTSLSLDVKLDCPTPMSVDSTPLSDATSSKMLMSVERAEFESLPTTAETQMTDEGFKFEEVPDTSTYIPVNRNFNNNLTTAVFSKRVTKEESSGLSANCLKVFLYESISIPLAMQTQLVNNELLKYFINELGYLKHLNSLRNYFFLQDGEFGRNITESLFEKLYSVHCPVEMINCRTLQNLVFEALQMSNKSEGNSASLSFKINSLPKRFDLGDPDVLDCLSLTYKINWPLNIILPTDTIAKYDEVFKYLVKLNRVSWVLKKIFFELKILAKVSGKKQIYLMMSPHYRRLHQCRHVMLHFIQTLQNYVVGEVLHSSWEVFEHNLATVNNLDSLYAVHTTYIKNILFLSLLNHKSAPLRKVIQKIFVVILKFYDYLRSRNWQCENGVYVHPNFGKLESIFRNFEEFIMYLFKIGRKATQRGYQPQLTQLLDMLDISGYYSTETYAANA